MPLLRPAPTPDPRTTPVATGRALPGWLLRAGGVVVAASLLLPVGPAAGDPPQSPAQRAAEARARQETVRRERAEAASRIDAMASTEAQLQAALEAIDVELRAREAHYGDAKAAADAARNHASELQAAIEADEAAVADLEARLRERAVSAYVAPDPDEDPTRVFDTEHLSDGETRRVFAEVVNGSAHDLIDEVQAAKARLTEEKRATEAALVEADAKQREAEAALAEVQVMRDEQARVKAAFDQKIYEERAHSQTLAGADAELTQIIQQAETEQRQQEEAARRAAASRAGRTAGGGAVAPPGPRLTSAERPASATGMVWPISGTVSQEFGGRNGHPGIDIFAPMGTPIYAAKAGSVIFAGWNNGGYGNLVLIDHGSGFVTAYAHQSEVLVSVGQSVATGQLIGREGSTGYSTGPHLHFETRVSGGVVNPRLYLP